MSAVSQRPESPAVRETWRQVLDVARVQLQHDYASLHEARAALIRLADFGSKLYELAAEEAYQDISDLVREIWPEEWREKEWVPGGGQGYLSLPTIDEVLASMAPPGDRLETGLKTLDKCSRGGFARGRVYTVLGPPGAGKTSLIVQIARTFAERYGALVIGLFFDEGAWQAALMAAEGLGFERRTLEDSYKSVRSSVKPKTDRLDFRLPPPADANTVLDAIDGWLKGLDTTRRPVVLAIDGVQTARVSKNEKPESRKDHADAVMSKARDLAQKYSPVVLLAAKANRASWSSKNPSDNIDPLAAGLDSSSIEYMSDALLFIHGGDSPRLDVLRNRPGDGTRPRIPLGFNRDRATFTELDAAATAAEAETVEQERSAAAWSADERKVLKIVRDNPGRSAKMLRELLKMNMQRVAALLEELERKRRLEHRKDGWFAASASSGGEEEW